MKLNQALQRNIITYLSEGQSEMDAQKEMEELMSMISPNLKSQVTQHLFLNAIKMNSYLSSQQDILDFILHAIEAMHFHPEEYIIRQGEKPTHMYFLAHGNCEVLVRDQFKKESYVKTLIPGAVFGEVAILLKTRRTASIRCKDRCTVGALSEEHLRELIRSYPELQKYFLQNTKKYKDNWKMYQISLLSDVDYLADIPFITKEELHYKLQLEYHEKGAVILQKGQECNAIHFLAGGDLELFVEIDGASRCVDIL